MKTIVMISSPLPKWEKSFACLSEEQAQALVTVLEKCAVAAKAVTIEEYHNVVGI